MLYQGTMSQTPATSAPVQTGAESVHWDLSDLYRDLDDPQLQEDLEALLAKMEAFGNQHRGKLAQSLGQALKDDAEISMLSDKLMVYLFLRRSTDATDPQIQQKIAQVHESYAKASANHMNFFEHELCALSQAQYDALAQSDETVAFHRSLLDHLRANRKFLLDEPIERALTLRSPFGASEWSDYIEECEAELSFELEGEAKTLSEILHEITNNKSSDERAKALEVFHQGLKDQGFDRLMARTLNVVLGSKAVEDEERGYASPMSSRNIGNRVDDDTVRALHEAVAQEGAVQSQRYYRLLAAHLGKSTLRWSDRNACVPFADDRVISWDECVETVLEAYGSFSPTLRGLVQTMLDRKWIDAPPYAKKTSGAFNYAVLLPGQDARAYNFLNYLGSTRDVMTVAHEAGHGVHGLLAAKAQGALMFRAPMAYAETASIFGEMTTFRYLLERAQSDEQRLALLMDKCSDHINSVVRQISFSNFEQKIHAQRRQGKLTSEEFDKAWMEVTTDFYGQPGALFSYEHTENLWCYVSHFMRPFYVYAYAFGELFTQSLFAVKDQFGDKFEGMYLDLLRAGGSKDAVELMKPFGLDPREPSFWRDGIQGSIRGWLDQAEALSAKMNVRVA